MILVHADADSAVMSRWECGGTAARQTHRYVHEVRPVQSFGWDVIQEFRRNPPDSMRIDPPPRPTNSPAGAGTSFQEAA